MSIKILLYIIIKQKFQFYKIIYFLLRIKRKDILNDATYNFKLQIFCSINNNYNIFRCITEKQNVFIKKLAHFSIFIFKNYALTCKIFLVCEHHKQF